MRHLILTAGSAILLLFLCFGPAGAQSVPKKSAGTLVIVFRDGHRQSFSLADIARVEFPGLGDSPAAQLPSRARYLGKWEVGQGNGHNFIITLRDDGTAFRSLGKERGKWQYVNGEAQIRWDDGNQDAIRKIASSYKKCWYREGRAFSEEPDNVTDARNLTHNPAGVD